MKKLFTLFLLLLSANSVLCDVCENSKCSDLMSKMYDSRATISNVLNLTDDQKKCKETIDKKFQKEAAVKFDRYEQEKYVLQNMQKHGASQNALYKQEKVITNLEKELSKMNDDYDKEFRLFLDSDQKSKLKSIRKAEEKALKICRKNKALYTRDKNLKPFGVR